MALRDRCALLVLILPALAAGQDAPKVGPTAPMREQILSIPGDPLRPAMLQATLYLPPGPGPFPLAIINHGADGDPHESVRYLGNFTAWYFLSRGYATVMPMMRGFAGSGGDFEHDGCDLAGMALANARDLQAVVEFMAARPDIDASRMVMSGQSFGGWNTLGYGAIADPRVKGLISFAGGIDTNDCDDSARAMARGMKVFGGDTHIPSIWFHGDNDARFPPRIWRANYTRYTSAGGRAELVAYGVFDKDAHNFLGSPAALAIWTPRVDAFLARIGLPNIELYPEYLPLDPPKTNYAAIDDIDAVPFLNDAGKALYRKFLATPPPRAFIISPKVAMWRDKGFDPVADGLAICAKASANCEVYAFENDVVWTGPPPSTHIIHAGVSISTVSARAGGVARLAEVTSLKSDCTQRPPPTLRVTQLPANGTVDLVQREDFPTYPASNPLSVCNRIRSPLTLIQYTPGSGFKGVDFVGFSMTPVDGLEKLFKVGVIVR